MAKATARRQDDDDEDEQAAPADDLEDSRMPFIEHLRELRDRVRKAGIFFMAAFGLCWYFSTQIFQWLEGPLRGAWDEAKLGPFKTNYKALTEPFWVSMSIGLWAGIFVASPFIFYQLWKFIAPGLYKRERKITVMFSVCSALFFVSGALFCYYLVLHKLYSFLLSYSTEDLQPMIVMGEYLDLTRDMMLAFGAVFELPLLILFLAMVGLVTHRGLWKFNRWFVVIAFVVGAILTPSPDVVSQLMMATPMIVLYNLSIVLAYFVTRRREKADEALRERERIADEKERALVRRDDDDIEEIEPDDD